MGARLVIVSNRVAAPEVQRKAIAGELAVAVKAALKKRNGLWFGWSGNVAETCSGEPRRVEGSRFDHRAVQFSIQSRHVEYEIEVERCAPSGVFDVIASCGPEQVVSEGAQAGGDVRVLANA